MHAHAAVRLDVQIGLLYITDLTRQRNVKPYRIIGDILKSERGVSSRTRTFPYLTLLGLTVVFQCYNRIILVRLLSLRSGGARSLNTVLVDIRRRVTQTDGHEAVDM